MKAVSSSAVALWPNGAGDESTDRPIVGPVAKPLGAASPRRRERRR